MADPEIIQRQRQVLRTFRQAAAQRAQLEAEANARLERELTEITTRDQSVGDTAEQAAV